ncbi:hypothetical protein ED28_08715 [[Pantoea] beijingensis]|uniref:DNA utilization protein HofO C-terminal domain-containing protein n=1 Tax=[Pantoea] beijingensis TaxID=1324864 RepID=A0A443IEG0_9GAMM|nr:MULTISPECIES: hypothetical protein [Erwiniaceae]RWR02454.1 hypothetical protein ED28_08715 [[Pantoea] beijingensis]
MDEWLSRWLQIRPLWQWVTVMVLPPGFLLLIGWMWLQPLWMSQQRLVNEHQQLMMRWQTTLVQLLAKPRLAEQQVKNQRLRAALTLHQEQRFSLVALMRYAGGVVEQWQPQLHGGEITLLLSWVQLQRVFDYLVTRPLTLKDFTLQRSGERLRLTLLLGWEYEMSLD